MAIILWSEAVFADVFQNRCSLKFRNIHRRTLVLKSLFNNPLFNIIKKTLVVTYKESGPLFEPKPEKIKKIHREKNFLYFAKWNFLDLVLTIFLYFLIFPET